MEHDATIEQLFRCYVQRHKKPPKKTRGAEPSSGKGDNEKAPSKSPSPEMDSVQAARLEMGSPYDGWCLVFDTETTTDLRQALRVGAYAVYGLPRNERQKLAEHYRKGTLSREEARRLLDSPRECGIFYDPGELSAKEFATIEAYATDRGLRLLTRNAFITEVFYFWVYQCKELCIGHNLPFDLSVLARISSLVPARGGLFDNGFSFSLCDCRPEGGCFNHPNIQLASLGPKKSMIQFRKESLPEEKPGTGKCNKTTNERGRFLDTCTFGLALLGAEDAKLREMGKRFNADVITSDWEEDFGGPITAEFLDYLLNDLQATWSLYQAERETYRTHRLTKPLWQIYSEASLGKGYLETLGIPPFLNQHPDFPKHALGAAMQAYYGGRTEVACRLKPVEVMVCDFTSQYPTVNALMGLQDLLLAAHIDVVPCLDDAQRFLTEISFSPERLQVKSMWRQLPCFVLIILEDDSLPVRALYNEAGSHSNIGLNYVAAGLEALLRGEGAAWYTLTDAAASVVLTGKAPHIVDAFKLVPSPERSVEPKPFALFGDPTLSVDLKTQDFFAAIIDHRILIKRELNELADDHPRKKYLEGLEKGLKVLANSTAYGIHVEVNEDTLSEATGVDVWADRHYQTQTQFIAEPGKYFSGVIGALIPAAGRLLLAIAQRLGVEYLHARPAVAREYPEAPSQERKQLEDMMTRQLLPDLVSGDVGSVHAICDTDSMSFIRPEGMSRQDFEAAVEQIADWFSPLSPYQHERKLFKIEAENYRLENSKETREYDRLYCLAVSSKRYALYNRSPDGSIVIRKFSAHGLGGWLEPKGYVSDTPESFKSVYKLGGARWIYDLWYDQINRAHAAAQRDKSLPPSLYAPAMARISLSTWNLFAQFKNHHAVHPHCFFILLPHLPTGSVLEDESLRNTSFYAPFSRRFDQISQAILRKDTHRAVVDLPWLTLGEAALNYFKRPEHKMQNGTDTGAMRRRHLVVGRRGFIGKESKRVEDDIEDETAGILSTEAEQRFSLLPVDLDDDTLRAWVRSQPDKRVQTTTGLPRQTIIDFRNGKKPQDQTRRALIQAYAKGLIIDSGETLNPNPFADPRWFCDALKTTLYDNEGNLPPGVTLTEVARRCGISVQHLSDILGGRRILCIEHGKNELALRILKVIGE